VKQSAERISKVLGLANPLANYVNDDKQRNNQMGSGLTNQETPFLQRQVNLSNQDLLDRSISPDRVSQYNGLRQKSP